MTPTHPLPAAGVTQLLERFAMDLTRAGLAEADVTTAAHILKTLLARVRVRTRARPSSNGHHVPREGD